MANISYSYTPGKRVYVPKPQYRYGALAAKTFKLIELALDRANAELPPGARISGVTVVSGGQPAGKRINGQDERRPAVPAYGGGMGSSRHDFGGAGDIKLLDERGKVVTYSGAGKLALDTFAAAAAKLGATGIGFGPGYMGMETIHVGFGSAETWGSNKTGGVLPPDMELAVRLAWANPSPDRIMWNSQDEAIDRIHRLGYQSIEDFQRAMGLEDNGRVGPQTMTAAYMTDKSAAGEEVTPLAAMISPLVPDPPSHAESEVSQPIMQGSGALGLPKQPRAAESARYTELARSILGIESGTFGSAGLLGRPIQRPVTLTPSTTWRAPGAVPLAPMSAGPTVSSVDLVHRAVQGDAGANPNLAAGEWPKAAGEVKPNWSAGNVPNRGAKGDRLPLTSQFRWDALNRKSVFDPSLSIPGALGATGSEIPPILPGGTTLRPQTQYYLPVPMPNPLGNKRGALAPAFRRDGSVPAPLRDSAALDEFITSAARAIVEEKRSARRAAGPAFGFAALTKSTPAIG
jgi:hypothetical protein